MTRTLTWLGFFVGSTLGGLLPLLWGGDTMSISGLGLSMLCGVAGIVGGYHLGQQVG